MNLIKEKLLIAGVKNLKDFGYSNVDTENILNDTVYSQFFKNMLYENLGHSSKIDDEIYKLLSEIKN